MFLYDVLEADVEGARYQRVGFGRAQLRRLAQRELHQKVPPAFPHIGVELRQQDGREVERRAQAVIFGDEPPHLIVIPGGVQPHPG